MRIPTHLPQLFLLFPSEIAFGFFLVQVVTFGLDEVEEEHFVQVSPNAVVEEVVVLTFLSDFNIPLFVLQITFRVTNGL